MLAVSVLSAVLCANGVLGANTYPEPPPTFDPKPYTSWNKIGHKGSRRAEISVPFTNADGSADSINMYRVDLVGGPQERGYAHGFLLAKGDLFILDLFKI